MSILSSLPLVVSVLPYQSDLFMTVKTRGRTRPTQNLSKRRPESHVPVCVCANKVCRHDTKYSA